MSDEYEEAIILPTHPDFSPAAAQVDAVDLDVLAWLDALGILSTSISSRV
jgi:hypothetical protein